MHITLLGPYPPPFGGVQTHVVALRAYLRRAGLRVSLINLTRHRREPTDEVYYPKSAAAVLGRLAALRPDLLHVHCGGTLTRPLLGLFVAVGWWPGAHSVLTFHSGGYPSSPAGQTARPRSWRGFALRQFDHLIAVNPEIQEVFHRYGVPALRTSVIAPHSGNGHQDPTAIPAPLRDFAAAHRPLLVTVGLLEPHYNVELQLQALSAIRERTPSAGLVIIGSGSLEAELRRRIAASPTGKHVVLCGDVQHDLTLSLIQQADLLLRTTSYDGDSISVREAQQLGTPVLASDNGMRPKGVELLRELSCGALAARVVQVLTEGQPRRAPASLGDENLARVLEVYRELLPRRA